MKRKQTTTDKTTFSYEHRANELFYVFFRMELKTSSVLAVLASVTMFVQVFSSPIGDASQVICFKLNKYTW